MADNPSPGNPSPGSPNPQNPRSPHYPLVIALSVVAVAALVVSLLALRTGRSAAPFAGRRSATLTAQSTKALSPGAVITVTGSGTVKWTPDTVSFGIGVNTLASTASGALEANNASVLQLEKTLESHGVTKSDLQTSSLQIYDKTDKYGNITGFSVNNTLNVQMHDTAAVGSAIDSAANAVGNGISLNGISFSISNESSLLAKARGNAMTNARTEAEQVAAGAGLALGPVVKVNDTENTNNGQYFYSAGLAAATDSVPIQAGRQAISVQVSVVYQLKA
jgi:hypothetical protein